jgi:hypothetical protein
VWSRRKTKQNVSHPHKATAHTQKITNMISSSYSSSDHHPSPPSFHPLSHRTDNVAQTAATTAAATTPPTTTATTFSKPKWILLVLFGLTWFNLGRSSRQLRVDGVAASSSGTSVAPTATSTSTTTSGWVDKEEDTLPRRIDSTNSTTTNSTSSTSTTTATNPSWTTAPQPPQQPPLLSSSSSSSSGRTTAAREEGGFWVTVPSYSEGISGWMISLAELLVFCKTYNATFVLPRIYRGRLSTPNYINPTTKTIIQQQGMPVLDLFDATLIHDYYSALVSIDEYHTAVATYIEDNDNDRTKTTAESKTLANNNKINDKNNKSNSHVKRFSVCMTYWQGVCEDAELLQKVPTGRFGRREGLGMYSPTVEAALQYTKEYPHAMVVLELHQYLRHTLLRKHLRPYHRNETNKESQTTMTTLATTMTMNTTTTQKLISDEEFTHVMQSVFQFHSKYDSLATKALQLLGIAPHEPYLTFHWRAEKKDLDYMNCAHALVESKNHVVSQYHNINNSTIGATTNTNARSENKHDMNNNRAIPVILLSSLNTDVDLEWAGAKNLAYNTSAPQALAYLLQPVQDGGGGLLKLDSVLSQVLQLPTQQQQQLSLGPATTTTPTRTITTSTTTTTTNNDTHSPPDMIVTVVLDLILALRSHQFVTCTRACMDSLCKDCNVLTKFGNFTLTLRRYRQQQQQQQQEARQDRLRGTRQLSDSSSSSTTPSTTSLDNGDAISAEVWVDPIRHHLQDYQCWPTRMEEKDDITTLTSLTRPNTTTIIQNIPQEQP